MSIRRVAITENHETQINRIYKRFGTWRRRTQQTDNFHIWQSGATRIRLHKISAMTGLRLYRIGEQAIEALVTVPFDVSPICWREREYIGQARTGLNISIKHRDVIWELSRIFETERYALAVAIALRYSFIMPYPFLDLRDEEILMFDPEFKEWYKKGRDGERAPKATRSTPAQKHGWFKGAYDADIVPAPNWYKALIFRQRRMASYVAGTAENHMRIKELSRYF